MCSPSVSLKEFQPSFGFTESELALPCKTGSKAAHRESQEVCSFDSTCSFHFAVCDGMRFELTDSKSLGLSARGCLSPLCQLSDRLCIPRFHWIRLSQCGLLRPEFYLLQLCFRIVSVVSHLLRASTFYGEQVCISTSHELHFIFISFLSQLELVLPGAHVWDHGRRS